MSAKTPKTIIIINGPNINMLGQREALYGTFSLSDLEKELQDQAPPHITLKFCQSNNEGELITAIQTAKDNADGLIINPAAFTHTSIGIKDALACLNIPKIEVHISNIYTRETFRHHSYSASECTGIISGLGKHSYIQALAYLCDTLCPSKT